MAFEFDPKVDFGIEGDINSKEDFFEAFGKTFIQRSDALKDKEIISKITGKAIGSLTTKARQMMDLTGETIEGDTPEAVIEYGVKKWREKLAKGSDNEEVKRQLEEMQTKIKAKDQEVMEANIALQQKEAEFNTRLKTFIVETKLNEIVSKLPLRSDLSEFERVGMQTLMKSYDWNEDEETGELMPFSNGEPVKNAAKTANVKAIDFLTEKLSPLLSRNGSQQAPKTAAAKSFSFGTNNDKNEAEPPKMHPRALARANR